MALPFFGRVKDNVSIVQRREAKSQKGVSRLSYDTLNGQVNYLKKIIISFIPTDTLA